MRLLNTDKLELDEFGANEIPLYAILSHRWRVDEITFQDIKRRDENKETARYEKVRKTCSTAAAHGFKYVWIDTCCIDKTSSAELSEAINSMYRWYQESGMCYAYLDDVPSNAVNGQTGAVGAEFSKSRWFTRGWTLQELIAPSMVIFLDQAWQEIGTKSSLQSIISEITGIPDTILKRADLGRASVAQRMSWASKRETTRLEDLAYCLMGVFGVNMPMLYGEGERAFLRLQEEIMKVSDDQSLFAWKSSDSGGGLLATSPAAFARSSKIISLDSSSTLSGAISVNNKGIHLKVRFMDIDRIHLQRVKLAILPCAVEGETGKMVGIYVRAMSEANEYFIRTNSCGFEVLSGKDFDHSKYPEKTICVRQERQRHKNQSPLAKPVENGNKTVVKMLLEKGAQPDQELLAVAAFNGHEAVVKLLLEKGVQPDQESLLKAAESGHEAVVKLLLEKGAQLDQGSLLKAAESGHEAVVKLLLEKGLQPNQGSLSVAAESGHEAVVKLLLEKGAQLDQESLLKAAESGHEAVVKLLLEKGLQPNRRSLSVAAESGHEAVVKLLLEKGAQLDQESLEAAAESGHEAVVKLLLEKGAQLDQGSLFVAVRNGHEAVVKLLLEKGPQPDQESLFVAVRNGHEAVVKLLLEKGAQPDQRSLLWAAQNGHKAVAMLALEMAAEKSQ